MSLICVCLYSIIVILLAHSLAFPSDTLEGLQSKLNWLFRGTRTFEILRKPASISIKPKRKRERESYSTDKKRSFELGFVLSPNTCPMQPRDNLTVNVEVLTAVVDQRNFRISTLSMIAVAKDSLHVIRDLTEDRWLEIDITGGLGNQSVSNKSCYLVTCMAKYSSISDLHG